MSSHCVEKLPHKCGSSDALQVFQDEDGSYSGYCFRCNTYIPDPYSDRTEPPAQRARLVKSQEEIDQELAEVATLTGRDLPHRKLHKWALDYFGVKVGVSEEDGQTPTIRYFPYYSAGDFVHYKAKIDEGKKFFRVGPKGEADLFGWKQALSTGSGPKLYITEGEDDAVALYQALKEKSKGTEWASQHPPVVSLVNGSSGARKDLIRLLPAIRASFKEFILCFDMDEAGKMAVQSVMSLLPLAKRAELPEKDANDCVIKGKSRALADSVLFRAAMPKNTRLVLASSLYDDAKKPAEYGLSWPWDGLTKMTRGIRFGETYYLGSGVKMGKTEFRNSVAVHLMNQHNLRVVMAALEEDNKKTVKLVLGKAAGTFFHDPEVEFNERAYEEAAARVGDKLVLLDVYQHADWQTLRDDLIHAAGDGCRAGFIDPITNVVNGLNAAEVDTLLREMAPDMAALARELKMALFIFCHLKAPPSGDSHEQGGKVFSSQFAGSRAMMRSCNYMFGLEGNKSADLDADQRNMRRLVVLEDREFGSSGYINLYWDRHTGLFNEVSER